MELCILKACLLITWLTWTDQNQPRYQPHSTCHELDWQINCGFESFIEKVMVIFHLEKIAHRPKEGMLREFSFGNCSRSSGSDHYRVDDGAVGGDHQEWGLTGQIISRLMFLVTNL